jgi:hypothetical protein
MQFRKSARSISLLFALTLTGCQSIPGPATSEGLIAAPQEPLVLSAIGRLGPGAVKECSGIVRSRRDPAAFWTLNDSGDEPRVYPVRAGGEVIPSVRYPSIPGTLIGNAINGDWEDIAIDSSGRLIIADFGNNSNARADLSLYLVPEPETTEGRSSAIAQIYFHYPQQPSLPAPRSDFNYDAEAIYTIDDDIYILTKHRSNTCTRLYRVDGRTPGVSNPLRLLETFEIGGQPTGADASGDGLRLAVLTYDRVWLFERDSTRDSFFAGTVRSRRYALASGEESSCEAICFETDDTLLIVAEDSGELFRVDTSQLPIVRP